MLNQCNFIGRLGADPESRFTNTGKQVVNFGIAVSEKYNGQETTEWVSVVVWDKLAGICEKYLNKGSLVFISGKMQTRKWQDLSGNDRYTTEIICRDMEMLGGRQDGDRQTTQSADYDKHAEFNPTTGQDVPF